MGPGQRNLRSGGKDPVQPPRGFGTRIDMALNRITIKFADAGHAAQYLFFINIAQNGPGARARLTTG